MSLEPHSAASPTQDASSPLETDLRFAPRQRRLAKLSYRLACAGPFAFWVMSVFYPQTNSRTLPALSVQLLWWVLCLCSPAGAILGSVVLFRFYRGTLGARKMGVSYAIAAIVVGGIASVALPLGTADLNKTRDYNRYGNAKSALCATNVRQLGIGLNMYHQDYDERYPLPNTWNDVVLVYLGGANKERDSMLFHCPDVSDDEIQPDYAMNRSLLGASDAAIRAPEQTVMLFDSIPGKNQAGGKGLLPNPLRHHDYNTIGFVDGHVKGVPRDHGALDGLIWTPQLEKQPRKSNTDTSGKAPVGKTQEAR